MTQQLIAIVFLLAGIACAQIERGSSDIVGRLRVRVAFGDPARCDLSTRVTLVGNTGFEVAESTLNGECVAEFYDVPSGRYRVTVRGGDAVNADDGNVEVSSMIQQDLEVRAKHTQGSDPTRATAGAAFVSVRDLQMPSGAAKEFEKASQFIAKKDWAKAIERLQRSLAIYPNYAGAYNNLGAVYSRMGRDAAARQALEKAISLDDHLAAAYVNLGRLDFLAKDYSAAESRFSRAIAVEPVANADALSLLAYAQLYGQHLDEALQTSRRGHEAKLAQHGFLHLIAANAYEQQRKIDDSISELRTYLIEEPNGVRAERVRSAIASLEAQPTSR